MMLLSTIINRFRDKFLDQYPSLVLPGHKTANGCLRSKISLFHHPRTHATGISISKSTTSAHNTLFKYSRLTGMPSL
jgi:hypothetical protein